MSFKKSKLPKINLSKTEKAHKMQHIRDAYLLSKKRNVISAFFLWILALGVIIYFATVSLNTFAQFKLDFSFLKNLSPLNIITGDSEPEKINILLAGIWWGTHDGPELTDTIMLASLNTKLKTVSLLSIPRDLYVEYPNGGEGRINELYGRGLKAYGQEKGAKYLEQKITEITGEQIDHFLVVDFDGFKKFVDLLDGLEVNIPEDLVDTEYPNDADWTYTTFSIKKGLQVLDGETALKYARSRHSTSDFDRSARQQLIMKAIKDKLLRLDYIGNPSRLKDLFSTVSQHINTDLSLKDVLSLALFAKELSDNHVVSFNLNDSCFQGLAYCQTGGFLYTPQRALFWGAAVLLPDMATEWSVSAYADIQKFANLVINYPDIFIEKYAIHVVNATKISGLANQVAIELKKYGFNVPEEKSVWSTKDPYPESKIFYRYDPLTSIGVSKDAKTLEALGLFVPGSPEVERIPKYSKNPVTDIEIVLGDDYKSYSTKQ